MKIVTSALALACALSLGFAAKTADAATRVVMKVSDSPAVGGTAVIDPYLDWIGTGGVNEGVAGASSLTNNGIDYKDSWVDSHWADVLSVRVSMYTSGSEVAFMEFDAAGTTKSDFFALGNLTSATWSDTGVPNNFFSIEGSPSNDRHWYVNRNWGGCPNDRGWMAVLDGSAAPGYACAFENSRTGAGSATRGFLYADSTTEQNFTSGSIGVADVFAVTVTTAAPIPVPASGLLLAGGLGALVWRKKRAAG